MRWDLALFMALTLALRIAFWLAMQRVVDTADAVHYLAAAQAFAQGDWFGVDPKIPPFYPFLGAFFGLCVRNIELACRLVSLVASTLLVVPVYLLARDLHGRGAARVAALVVCIWPWLIDYGSRVSTEALACTLWFGGVWLFARAARRGGLYGVAAALAFYGLHLTRPEGIVILAATVPAAVILCARDPAARGMRLASFAVAVAVLLALYALYMYQLTGAFTLSHRSAYILEDIEVSNVRRTPSGTLLLFIKTTADTLFDVMPIMLGPVLLIFLGVGLFRQTDRPRDVRLEWCVLWFATVQWAASLAVLSPAPRYLMATLIALVLWAARGIVLVSRQAEDVPWGRRLRALPIAAVVATMAFGSVATVAAEHMGRRPRQPREYKAAGRWMHEHLEPGLIFTRKPQVGYYAGMPTTGPAADDSLDTALERARSAGARYVVVDERYTVPLAPSLEPLLAPAHAPPDLRLLHQVEPDYPQARVVIYEILPTPATEGSRPTQ